eukprot:15337134-Ditylum_brightwellii.AAC.1
MSMNRHKQVEYGPNQEDIDQALKDLKNAIFDFEDKGNIEDYLGMTIDILSDGTIIITQQKIIPSIIDEVPFLPNLKNKGDPVFATKPLTIYTDVPKFDKDFLKGK